MRIMRAQHYGRIAIAAFACVRADEFTALLLHVLPDQTRISPARALEGIPPPDQFAVVCTAVARA